MHLSRLGNGERNLGGAKGPRGPSERARASQSRCAISGEHTRPRVWFATPRREHWGKTFDAGARRTAREARALPFELIPEPALSRGNQTKAEGLGVAGGFLLQPLAFSPQPSNAGCPGSSHVCHDVAGRKWISLASLPPDLVRLSGVTARLVVVTAWRAVDLLSLSPAVARLAIDLD